MWGERQLLNTTEEGLSGCVFYSWLVLEGIKPHSKQMNPVRVEMMGSGCLQGQGEVSGGSGTQESLLSSLRHWCVNAQPMTQDNS